MPKKENENQLDLFEFDPIEKELRIEEINRIKSEEKKASEKQRKEVEDARRMIESKKEFSIHRSSELYRYEIFESGLGNGL